ncbi:MAG: TIGR04283 family arsenosugar biosynthesis glycosyltransferase [Betaproteobacteria bacterium]
MRVSIIVPALDEARGIVGTLTPLASMRAAGHEVIVVDGGSSDATLALASPLADRAFVAKRGRAAQMNAGAAVAAGEILLFLHADSQLPAAGLGSAIRELDRSGRQWGRFDVTIAGAHPALAAVATMMNLRSRLTGIATGDQAIFVERALFDAVGGYPDQPLMEDIELSKRLKRAGGRPLCLAERVTTSGRRWERDGTWRTIVAMWGWRFAYWRHADPGRLALEYRAERTATPVTLQVFAKNPVAGAVKTRLAATIGNDAAAALYTQFVDMTLATANAARLAGVVDRVELWCASDIEAAAFVGWRDRYSISLEAQSGVDLGARMLAALDCALAMGSRAILIGTDCPTLDVAYLARAVAALDAHDAVFGPAEDGGYVLVGLARHIDAFTGVPWSAPDTMAATRAKLEAQRASWEELPALWDIDEPADLDRWQALIASTGSVPVHGSMARVAPIENAHGPPV